MDCGGDHHKRHFRPDDDWAGPGLANFMSLSFTPIASIVTVLLSEPQGQPEAGGAWTTA
jgi:hypothetical protein